MPWLRLEWSLLWPSLCPPGHRTDAAGEQKIEWLSHDQHSLLPERCLTPKCWKAITETRNWQRQIIKLVMKREDGHTYLFILVLCFDGQFRRGIKRDIITVQHWCASFIFWDVLGITSKVFNWNVKELYNTFWFLLFLILFLTLPGTFN